jgi:hypothetical protein
MMNAQNGQSLAADFETLKQNLQAGFFGDPTKPGGDRVIALQARYTLALANVAKFLERNGCDKDVAGKFIELGAAIIELRHGTIADVLRPANVGGRGPDGLALWSRRAMVATAIEGILKSRKMNKQKAAEYVAQKYPVFDRLKHNPGDSLASAILSWRRYVKEGKVPASADIRAYQRRILETDLPAAERFAQSERLLAEAAEETTKAAF